MNYSFVGAGYLLCRSLTDTSKGLHHSFNRCVHPQKAQSLFETAIETAQNSGVHVESGLFGQNMRVQLIHD